MSATERYREARDLLISLRGRHDEALERFDWPDVGERFNWAVDWFDAIARGNDAPALVVVAEDGSSEEVSFDAMAARSDRVGRWLLGLGVGRGDPVLLMLGNRVELWDVMLAVMKIGAVIVPTATAAGAADLADRVARSGARAVVTTPDQTAKFAELGADLVRVSVGATDGWADLGDAYAVDVEPLPHPGTAPGDPLLLYFTSGTTARPKLVEHTQVSYPVGHLSTPTGSACSPVTGTSTCPARAGRSTRGRASSPPGSRSRPSSCCPTRGSTPRGCSTCCASSEVTSFCAPPTVWRMLINADLSGGPGVLREVVGAGEPLNPEVIEQVRRAWGLDLRDGYGQTEMTAAVGNTPEVSR